MTKKSRQSKTDTEPTLVAYFNVECGYALVLENELEWLSKCSDVVARSNQPLELKVGRQTQVFDVVPVSDSILRNVEPKDGDRRRHRNAKCGGNKPAVAISCFPLSSGRFAKIELAGYFFCVRGQSVCDETYVKIGEITIATDPSCRRVVQRHPQYRWLCLPEA